MEFSYFLHEASLALIGPARAATEAARLFFENPANPASWTPFGRSMSAACDVFERSTRRYEKPEFGLTSTLVGGEQVAVTEEIVWQRPFGRLIHFARALPASDPKQPKISHGRSDVGPLRDAVARHGRGLPSPIRGLHHRLVGCAHGAADGGAFRLRRLRRLRHRDAAPPRPQHPCDRGLPAFSAGLGRRRRARGAKGSRSRRVR